MAVITAIFQKSGRFKFLLAVNFCGRKVAVRGLNVAVKIFFSLGLKNLFFARFHAKCLFNLANFVCKLLGDPLI